MFFDIVISLLLLLVLRIEFLNVRIVGNFLVCIVWIYESYKDNNIIRNFVVI